MKKSELKQRLAEEVAHNEKLQCEVKQQESIVAMYRRESEEKGKQIEELHAMFDTLEGVAPRTVKDKSCSWDRDVEVSLASRFASFLNGMLAKTIGGAQ
jgi:hypothetical protein